ncbi:hypothetical protein EJ02DRAFT_235722 [Clathrospora elynae]|uniref:Uncharacterized protein n=1 Tax=Clathrospora elynae TaxID=706981 RepID=A0A6A5T1L6_9PLEO|nr:hypothetical protein EJ02DRAFT_235722 [Clathrospora elynae]
MASLPVGYVTSNYHICCQDHGCCYRPNVRVTQSMQLPGNKVELIESYGGTLTSFQCASLIYRPNKKGIDGSCGNSHSQRLDTTGCGSPPPWAGNRNGAGISR